MKALHLAITWFTEARRRIMLDVGLLILRVSVGASMLLGHGWGKLTAFSERSESFPDPLGVGSQLSMLLAISAEFFCSILIVLGLATRAAAVPLIVTMLVALLLVHGDDPWRKKELAFMYLVPFMALALTGAGRWSLDAIIVGRLTPSETEQNDPAAE